MKFTGERMIPEFNSGSKIYLEHISRYFFANQFIKGKNVLDIACGSGYGSEIFFNNGANSVLGVDISEETIKYCKNKYPNIKFKAGSVEKIPAGDKSIDVIVSFETIEHVDEGAQEAFMREVNRVLRDDGILILSTPNALVYEKGNEFHIKELTPDELNSLLVENDFEYEIFFQESVDSNYIFSAKEIENSCMNEGNGVIFENKEKRLPWDARYLIVVCTKTKKNLEIASSIYVSNIRSLRYTEDNIEEFYKIIGAKDEELRLKNKEIKNVLKFSFWRLKEFYLKIRHWLIFIFLNPRKFIRKYLKI
ncbi:MAG: Glycosyltransferase, group 2 family protein [Candidatus Moranbacteria bacterium GW2011_GWE1_35_17]|nr:MAG: Glycosyltransferase, group 2 family protein [Candidatus Moranbacteria bacterium GW2011_GWE1_35_17]KKP72316.1 MAG: Glycosyltransferase, group 2 family protein [Candidatus Moranbacteria bacterium GW2011_GWE2_35_164]KKP84103.1 MAG: Glycosyltransferase, group 2 family protein [Candidatus Moranbacteria bacterium GW2011_GWF2_35_54]